MYKHI